MRERRRLLCASAGQAGWSGEVAIDASNFQRDQNSYLLPRPRELLVE